MSERRNFNSRPCGRGDDLLVDGGDGVGRISIHAPAGGATRGCERRQPAHRFQFTPLREGRRQQNAEKRNHAYFNSRPCGRGDAVQHDNFLWQGISIHAPAGGATPSSGRIAQLYLFQFTPLREGRQKLRVSTQRLPLFQFTPLREGRRIDLDRHFCHGFNFNSRPCGRGDAVGVEHIGAALLFQFTPLREGRLESQADAVRGMFISIHAPAGGATCRGNRRFCTFLFQFTPLREGRRAKRWPNFWTPYFNSRPCGRGDPGRSRRLTAPAYFNSRPCGRGDLL